MKKIFERRNKMNVNKGDEVVVIHGKDKGKKGIVKAVFLKANLIIVEGVNKFKKAVKVNQNNNENFLIKERPIFPSKVKVINKAKKTAPSKSKGNKNIKKTTKDVKKEVKKR